MHHQLEIFAGILKLVKGSWRQFHFGVHQRQSKVAIYLKSNKVHLFPNFVALCVIPKSSQFKMYKWQNDQALFGAINKEPLKMLLLSP